MKTIALTFAATILSGTAAFAATDIRDFDANGDGFASQAEVAGVFDGFTASDFRAIDSNSDNRISAVELQAPGVPGILGLYRDGGSALVGIDALDSNGDGFATFADLGRQYPGLTQADFREIDTNGDSRISFGELYAPRAQVVVSRRDAADRVPDIALLDTNGDGFADRAELLAAYPGLRSTDFRVIDGNRDNRVSFGELYSIEAQSVLNRPAS